MASARDELREYVMAQPSRQNDETVTAYMRRIGAIEDDTKTAPPKLAEKEDVGNIPAARRKLQREISRLEGQQKRYELSQAQARAKEAQSAADAAAQAEEERKARNSARVSRLLGLAGVPPNRAADWAERWRDNIANAPTPGGNGALLLILLFMIAFIVPVAAGGYTRAQLFWYTLLGRTKLGNAGQPAEAVSHSAATGASGDTATGRPAGKPVQGVTQVTAQPIPMTLPMPGTSGGPQLPS